MRLQVEIATASPIAGWAVSSREQRLGAAVGERDALAQRQRRGLVRGAEREQLGHRGTALLGGLLAIVASRASARRSRRSSSSLISPTSRAIRTSLEAMIAT